jgi:hypothetical protein
MKISPTLRYAIAGAAFFEIFSISASQSLTSAQLSGHVESLFLGSLAGWMFGALQEQISRGKQFASDVEQLSLKLELQEDALQMLLDCPKHNEVLASLIRCSAERYRLIPRVAKLDYLAILSEAINHSREYQGVQRKPARWFLEGDGPTYLETLRDSQVRQKTRLFIINDDEVPLMEEDIASDVIERYWQLTGSDVATYWISVENIKKAFPQVPIPRDSAFYDQSLAIEYDSDQHLLHFDVLAEEPNGPGVEIFRLLDLQRTNNNHHSGPFRLLLPSDGAKG